MNVLDHNVSYFRNKTWKKPYKMNLYIMLTCSMYKVKTLQVRNEPDETKRKLLKGELPCYTPSGLFTAAKGGRLVKPTGLICLDIDKKDNLNVADFGNLKERLSELPYVAYCGLSCGGEGYFCIIPITDTNQFKGHFRSLQKTFKEMGITIDPACSDIGRKRFVSYDPAPYINTEAIKYEDIEVVQPWVIVNEHGEDVNDEQLLRVLRVITDEEIDITDTRTKWLHIGCAFANEYGEMGRELFHTVSQYHPNYTYQETDRLFDDVLKHRYNYSIGTFYHYAREAGVLQQSYFDPVNE